mmetsp:Transcript_14129/g.17125  ORF Transcript_14129/g.17125 Transcript_14129/m.17125 type:complete len:204 (+) Transcript_14129:114-725(+)|eukprot:CAMPEP_0197861558 /NCGR_PEP_ID=MMETSP1438-20131217/37717_1 /TAXON_ID=1461541 /ORGANISM="Pterosperma sp., Strain CCMP1384" /LENGTH=203 /DNA_ID=CAMNT_0043478781 /DNA_START=95 /DNA_END=706 /DNA_ORIENTATION=-
MESPKSSKARSPTSRSRSASPTKTRRWHPDSPFDSTCSRRETLTQTYDAVNDPHLSEVQKKKMREMVSGCTNPKSFTYERDRQHILMEDTRTKEQMERESQLVGLHGRRPEIYQRVWDLSPNQRAYYPSLLSAGGSELCPIKRRLQINPPTDRSDNQSLLASRTWSSTMKSSVGNQSAVSGDSVLSATLRKHLCSLHQTTVDI